MDALDLAKTRYTAKHYDTSKTIPQEKVDELKQVFRLSPSSINIQPWKFIFVQDVGMKRKLAAASLYNEAKVNEAGLLVVFCVADDLAAFEKVVKQSLPKDLSDRYLDGSKQMPEAELRAWLKNQVYISLGIGLGATIAMGLDSTPMEGIEPDKYIEILSVHEYRPILAMAVGYATADDYNRLDAKPKSRRPLDDVVVSY